MHGRFHFLILFSAVESRSLYERYGRFAGVAHRGNLQPAARRRDRYRILERYFLELDDWMLGGQGKLRPVALVALTSDPSAAQECTFMVVEARTSFIFA